MRNALVLLGVGAAVAAGPAAARASTPEWSDSVELAHGSGGAIGIDADGEVTATWATLDARDAFVATRRPGSDRFGDALSLGGPGARAPRLAVNESGAAVVAWIERDAPCEGLSFVDCDHRIGVRTRAADAAGFGPPAYVSEDALETPTVAINEAGTAVLAWAGNGGTVSAALGSARSGFGAPALLLPRGGPIFAPRIAAAIGEGGAAVVSWGTFGAPPMASYRPEGGGFGPAEAMGAVESVGTTSAVVDSRGTATVAYLTNERARLRVATRAPSGSFRELESPDAHRVGSVGLDLDPSGDQLLHWTQQTSPEENSPRLISQAFASFRDSGESWGGPIAILRSNSEPILKLDRLGNAHALWTTDPSREGQRVMGGTLTRFGILEQPQELTRLKGAVADMEANRSGAAVGLYTEYLQTGPDFDAVVRVVSRPADVRPATVRVAVSVGASAARIRARCDEPCRLRARVGGQAGAAATRRPATLTLRAHRRGSLRVRLGRAARERLRSGRRVALFLRAADGAGNVRRLTRRLTR